MKIRIVSPFQKWTYGHITVGKSRLKRSGGKYLFVNINRDNKQVALLQLTSSQAYQLANELVDAMEFQSHKRDAA